MRPKFVAVDPDQVEMYGPAAALVLAHIRYRCESDGPGRVDDQRWWRVSLRDLSHEVGLTIKVVRTALDKLANVVAAKHFPPSEDHTLAYRLADKQAPDQPVAPEGTVSAPDQPVAPEGTVPPCPTGHGTVPHRASAPLLETVETKEPTTSVRKSARRRSPPPPTSDSESAATANTSDDADPGVSDEGSTTPGEEPVMKHDPDQDAIPGMLIALPTNRSPVPEPDPAPAGASRADRATRLPDGWTPPPEVVAEMRDECPNVDQALELRKFRDYWTDQPGAKGRKVRWVGTYRNWIRKAASEYPRNGHLSRGDAKVVGWLQAGGIVRGSDGLGIGQ